MILFRYLRKFLDRTLFNPRDWITWALLSLAAFALFRLLGWRDATSIISGTVSSTSSLQSTLFHGALYTLAWFAAILLAPILLLATAIHFALTRLFPERTPSMQSLTENTELTEKDQR